ncbi:MAG: hypothetical protein IAE91_01750 [Ignavibacteriaceae bacterium]|nr:hypothetical protein [Ignavibacteriaceae bacterium]
MSINKTRSFLYRLAKILGDVNAVQKGKIGERVVRRASGKATGNLLGKLMGMLFKK